MSWLNKIAAVARSRKIERDLDEELKLHIELKTQENIAAGMLPEEARYAALRAFGGVEQKKEQCRDADRLRWLEDIIQDLRYGLRQLRRNPGFTAIAVLTLALGIGANTAIFSILDAIVLRPVPYMDAGRLAVLWTDNLRKNLHAERTSYPNFEDWRRQNRTFEDMAFASAVIAFLTGGEGSERILTARVTPNFFSMLGISPILGRVFTREDEARGERVIVLSYGMWQRRFGGSKEVLGKTFEVNGSSVTVIGVMPPTLQLPARDVQFWEPNSMFSSWNKTKVERGIPSGYVIGRLKPRVAFEQAQADMDIVGSRLARQYPDLAQNIDFFGFKVSVVPLNLEITGKQTRLALWLLFGAVVLVLMIACSNVANLLLSRGATRARELAIRTAVGAGRIRLLRQLLTETVLLFLASGTLGVGLASIGMSSLIRLAPPDIPRLDQLAISREVLAFALGLSLLTGILFGIAPALNALRTSLEESLKGAGRALTGGASVRLWHNVSAVGEYALAVVLLAGAGLLIRSLLRVQAVDPGFRPKRVLLARAVSPSIQPEFYPQVLERIKSLPGVEAAGAIDNFFFSYNPDDSIVTEDQWEKPATAGSEQVMDDGVSEDYFRVIGVPLIKGRFFSERDGADSPRVAIVNQTLARRFWPREDPIGKRFRFGFQKATEPWITVVGVVGDMRRDGLTKNPVSEAFLPMTQVPAHGMDMVMRTASDPERLAASVRSAVHSVDRTVPVVNVSTLDQYLHQQTAPMRFETTLLTVFGMIALLLSGIGIYGITHYSVAQRTHEIGVRMALGARRADVLRLVLGHGVKLTVIGVGVGVAGALALTRFLSSLLYDVKPSDPMTFVAVAVILIAVALLACYIPARRAAKVDPMVALRYE